MTAHANVAPEMAEPKQTARWRAPGTSGETADRTSWIPLERRGVHHGFAREERPHAADRREARRRWERDRPILLPGILTPISSEHRAAVARTLRTFETLRADELSFQDEVWERVGAGAGFEPAGVTVDLGDEREVEKVFADAVQGTRRRARDLYAKLSWVSTDERDDSLRVRFSFGSEALFEWIDDPRRAPWSDRFAEAVFPECAALTGNAELTGLIDRLAGRRVRCSERIVYSNAPGGGAVFHHDFEPHQLGVVYGQLAGRTAWLALPKRELAEVVLETARGELGRRLESAEQVLAALGEEDRSALAKLLNRTPRFTRRLVERGACFCLREGDALLMPSHGPDDVCWHAVFGLGERPSLAHSYGLFARRRTGRTST